MYSITPVNTFYLPSGRVIVSRTSDGYLIESTEMRDVKVQSKSSEEVRETFDPKIIWRHLGDIQEKWLLTVSTQKGCPHNCHFCDVAPLPFQGNLTKDEILDQVRVLINSTPEALTRGSAKAKVGFARMGEPSHNLENVLQAMTELPTLSDKITWLPCFNSIFPRKTIEGLDGVDVLKRVLDIKENVFDGNLHLQISVNSTDNDIRKSLFAGANVLSIEEIMQVVSDYPITKRTVTLNFISMQGVPIDVQYLQKLGLTSEKFAVKVIPLNTTNNGVSHDLETEYNYENYEELQDVETQFRAAEIPTVIDAVAKCEEAGLCCGQILQDFYTDNITNS